MVQTLALIGLIILFMFSLYYNKKRAKSRCVELLTDIENYENISVIAKERVLNKDFFNLIKNKEKVYLIIREKSQLTIYSLNNQRTQTILNRQYERLIKKTSHKNPTFTYSWNSYSVFYRFSTPYERIILRIDS